MIKPLIKNGTFFRPSDGRRIQRYRCKCCGKNFSSATFDQCFGQNKRKKNHSLKMLLCSGVSMRRAALILRIHRITVVRKMKFLAKMARISQEKFLQNLPTIANIQFDDLQTIERSKCLPVAVTLMVESSTRKILGFEVASMPANGHLAAISRAKYGKRKEERPQKIRELFERLSAHIDKGAHILSDQHPLYFPLVKKIFPHANYQQTKGRKGCVVGQGELKKIGYDPLFSLNHTCAMLRANINRLFRRTWCTTKSIAALADHIAIYVDFHNTVLTN